MSAGPQSLPPSDRAAATLTPSGSGSPLRLVASTTIARGTQVGGVAIGGLSGIAYDPDEATVLALSDVGDPARFYTFGLTLTENDIGLAPRDVRLLQDGEGQPLPTGLDPEGIARSPDGTLFIASENDGAARPPVSPALFQFTRRGRLIRRLRIPGKYRRASREARSGIVMNHAFESLALSPDGAHLFTATETALLQDRRDAAAGGALARLLQYDRRDGTYEPAREEVYPVEPPAVPADFETFQGENGLVELLALNDTDLLALERSFVVETGAAVRRTHQRIRLYRVSLGHHTDVLDRFSLLDGAPFAPLEKTLLLDFDDRSASLPGLIVDNFEGMTFGPALADGRRTLILVADDNFSDRQVTAFLAFAFDDPAR